MNQESHEPWKCNIEHVYAYNRERERENFRPQQSQPEQQPDELCYRLS